MALSRPDQDLSLRPRNQGDPGLGRPRRRKAGVDTKGALRKTAAPRRRRANPAWTSFAASPTAAGKYRATWLTNRRALSKDQISPQENQRRAILIARRLFVEDGYRLVLLIVAALSCHVAERMRVPIAARSRMIRQVFVQARMLVDVVGDCRPAPDPSLAAALHRDASPCSDRWSPADARSAIRRRRHSSAPAP